jgi:membrane protein DedA with SNARE-associated domain
MLGEYHLNHALHSLQLSFLWFLAEATPHFGAFDQGGLDIPYARNFYDTDQRPLRSLLERFEPPMLILHGQGDVLVPYAAAVEHHRLVPHSTLVTFDTNHFMVFATPEELQGPMLDFYSEVEDGTALRRADAVPQRVTAAQDAEGFKPQPIAGFALMLTLVLLAVSTLGSEDLACIAAGLLVARGSLGFTEATFACGLGIFFGDLMLYFAGRFGRSSLHRAPMRWIVNIKALGRSQRWFARRGALVILLSRFVPGTRLPTYVAAGVLRMPVLWFTVNLLVPVALWTPFLVGSSRFLGEGFFATFEQFQRYALPGFAAFLITVWLLLSLGQNLFTWKGRRLLVGRWRRLRHWEFWPLWLFYPPVVLHILRLGLRYKCATLFTAANPGIPAGGGFIGESKATILKCLDPRWVASFAELPATHSLDERLTVVRDFQKRHNLAYPIVLKPDQGQRGLGVTIARRWTDVEAFLYLSKTDAIVQEYISGPELGVFYVRLPGDEKGRIFSITEKILPNILGDGHSTVEQLILADHRAVALAPLYLDRLDDRLEEVPNDGESIPIAEIGTHCLGALFLDGAAYLTPALEAAIETISQRFEGFYFGRFDLRAESAAAFTEGRGLKVLELNGITSEATHIYDPKNSLGDAYRVLREQWDLAFEIGHRNREGGTEPLSIVELARLLIASRASKK